jgi:group I intron endonuclease
MAIGVYQIQNVVNGKRYIGSATQSFNTRWSHHRGMLRRGVHDNQHLQRAFFKYGEESLQFSILEVVERPEECISREQHYLDEFRPEYNISPTAGNCLGVRHSDETRKKHSERRKGRPLPEETRAKLSALKKGRPLSEECRAASAAARFGSKRRLGKKHSEEARAKMSASHTGVPCGPFSAEHRVKLSEAAKNRSEETRHKLSEAAKKQWAAKRLLLGGA